MDDAILTTAFNRPFGSSLQLHTVGLYAFAPQYRQLRKGTAQARIHKQRRIWHVAALSRDVLTIQMLLHWLHGYVEE